MKGINFNCKLGWDILFRSYLKEIYQELYVQSYAEG